MKEVTAVVPETDGECVVISLRPSVNVRRWFIEMSHTDDHCHQRNNAKWEKMVLELLDYVLHLIKMGVCHNEILSLRLLMQKYNFFRGDNKKGAE